MRRIWQSAALCLLFLGTQACVRAQDTVLVPAGTLLHCTLDEPNFSSATADVGDPVICHLSALRLFGHSVFPRGAYLGGHLEAAKEPGHFVGKGYLKIEFDRIGFPNSDIPVPAKVIAAKGYKVDRKGDIVGKGHPKRDVVEWMIPPLWPWKIITLPAKGPRATLKGEEQVTVRLMDDMDVPQLSASNRYGRPPAPAAYHSQGLRKPAALKSAEPVVQPSPAPEISLAAPVPAAQPLPTSDAAMLAPTQPPTPALPDNASSPSALPSEIREATPAELSQTTPAESQQAAPAVSVQPARVRLLALKRSENVYAVSSYHINGGSVSYVLANGGTGSLDVTAVDWRTTSRLNADAARNSKVDSRTY